MILLNQFIDLVHFAVPFSPVHSSYRKSFFFSFWVPVLYSSWSCCFTPVLLSFYIKNKCHTFSVSMFYGTNFMFNLHQLRCLTIEIPSVLRKQVMCIKRTHASVGPTCEKRTLVRSRSRKPNAAATDCRRLLRAEGALIKIKK